MVVDRVRGSVREFSLWESGAATCQRWLLHPFVAEQAGARDKINIVLGSNIQSVPLAVLPDLRSPGYSLKQVIPVQIQSYQGHYLVSDTVTYRHGLGVTLDDAMQDYEDDLISYFESLVENRGNLSPALQRDLDRLIQFIQHR